MATAAPDPSRNPTVKALIKALQAGEPQPGEDPGDVQGWRVHLATSEVRDAPEAQPQRVVTLTADDGIVATAVLTTHNGRHRLADGTGTRRSGLTVSLPGAETAVPCAGLTAARRLIAERRRAAAATGPERAGAAVEAKKPAPAVAGAVRPAESPVIAGCEPMRHRTVRWMSAQMAQRPADGTQARPVYGRAYPILAVPGAERPHHIVVDLYSDDGYRVTIRLDATGPRLRLADRRWTCPDPITLHMRGGRACYGRPSALAARLAAARALDSEWDRVQTRLQTCDPEDLLVYSWWWADGTGGQLRLGDRFVYDWTIHSGAELAGHVARGRERVRAGGPVLDLDLVLPGGGHHSVTIAGRRER